ncbi:hypothetical protein SAMN05443633_102264 [Chryseobacterium arachidis]|uniref:Secreted protein n=1 Tax=Chryseobacterium arachidis TaxID=1416778 RepID=A0A1M4XA12_9FLAO|nr:hypothetical protein [Chryseobacterium arachidis]SHE89972.1 hypothetical protein SAMN05443633_102264 [Chryseobacterium arachidis]
MRTTAAMLLGLFCLAASTSCKCDFDEDEPKNKYDHPSEGQKSRNGNPTENDSIPLNK